MGKLIVVENDKVKGTDKHNVTGTGPLLPSGTGNYVGTGDFDYAGKMTDALSDLVKIGGKAVAQKSSKSSLNPGETASPLGKHSGPAGKKVVAGPGSVAPEPTPITLTISPDLVGEGKPSTASGSKFVSVASIAILLDGDAISTCDGQNPTNTNSTVTAEGQDFVSCSE